jgi:hypothetical protein
MKKKDLVVGEKYSVKFNGEGTLLSLDSFNKYGRSSIEWDGEVYTFLGSSGSRGMYYPFLMFDHFADRNVVVLRTLNQVNGPWAEHQAYKRRQAEERAQRERERSEERERQKHREVRRTERLVAFGISESEARFGQRERVIDDLLDRLEAAAARADQEEGTAS